MTLDSSDRCMGTPMAAISQFWLRSFVYFSVVGLAGVGLAQPTPTADRPNLAKDVQQAMDFLATWARVTSGQDYFKDANFVGSQNCGGAGCHDQQRCPGKRIFAIARSGLLRTR